MKVLVLLLLLTLPLQAWEIREKAPVCATYNDMLVAYKASRADDLAVIAELLDKKRCFLTEAPIEVQVQSYAGEILGETIWRVKVINYNFSVYVPSYFLNDG